MGDKYDLLKKDYPANNNITRAIELKEGWHLISSFLEKEGGETISIKDYKPLGWYPVSFPTTVLNALVQNNVYPDPRKGLNMYLIPDASDEFNEEYGLTKYSYLPGKRNPWKDPYWYRTEFKIPKEPAKRQWLIFNGINYRAEVWVNGKMVVNSKDMVGAFRRFKFDITDYVKGDEVNYLAVKIYGVDHPGTPGTQLNPLNITRNPKDGNNSEIMRDVTFNISAVGYDCAPEVRDRLMGIWQDVYIECTGDIDLRDPFIKTELPLPKTNIAELTVLAELINATKIFKKGLLKGNIEGTGIMFKKEVELKPKEIKVVEFSAKEFPQLIIDDPLLWWPVGYGQQNLYNMTLTLEVDGCISDMEKVTFGIRQITKELYDLNGEYGLRININGRKIFSRGGYLMVDTLLDNKMMGEERFSQELRYLKEANLNTFCMEDIPNLPNIFFDLCDKYGLMYWNNFHQCHWLISDNHPLDHDLLEKCNIDIVKRYRNHPSIVAHMCMNEGAALEEQYKRWRKSVIDFDGTRLIIPSGYGDYYNPKSWPEWIKPDTPVGANDTYPKTYGWKPHSWYYSMVRDNRSWMFKMESGSASLPPIESIERTIPDLYEKYKGVPDNIMDLVKKYENAPFPLNSTWAHHGANTYYKEYDEAIRRRFWEPKSLKDYCRNAHLLTADQHRAMFEAVNHLKWDVTSGFFQWKLNSCWPDIQWQLYDYYLKPMVSYYYIKKACGPLHIQLNPVSRMVTLINNYLTTKADLFVKAKVYDFNMNLIWEVGQNTGISADCYLDVFTIPYISDITTIYFVKLEILDSNSETLSDNFYWLSTIPDFNDTHCFKDLKILPSTKVNSSYEFVDNDGKGDVLVRIENPTDKLAFFISLSIMREKDSEEILPIYLSDNYFSLLPGEKKIVNAAFMATRNLDDSNESRLIVKLEGWNVEPTIIKMNK